MRVNVIKQINNIHSEIKYWCHTYGDTIHRVAWSRMTHFKWS